jgi:phosphatidylserine synthase
MLNKSTFPQKVSALLVYGRPPLVFFAMVCAIAVMWAPHALFYVTGVMLLFVSMSFDIAGGWFTARYPTTNMTLAKLADRTMDKVVYSIIFPLVSVGMMWRLAWAPPGQTRAMTIHAILVLLLTISVLVRDNFTQFIRSCVFPPRDQEPETREFMRLRTTAAAPVGVLLYIHAFYPAAAETSMWIQPISWLAELPLRFYFIIEILLLIITFGSIAVHCRKYGSLCLDEVCSDDDRLRRKILAFFPNALTVINALMGILAVFFAYQGLTRQAFLFLIGAAIFDKLDGALARKLRLVEPQPKTEKGRPVSLGGILDDIADSISFCLAPALIFYLTHAAAPDPAFPKSWLAAAAATYFGMGVLRLIYFTLDRSPIPGFFKGMPTPAAALLVVAPTLIFVQTVGTAPEAARFWQMFSLAIMFITSLTMNLYRVHYIHLGRFMERKPWFGRVIFLLVLFFVFTPYFGYFSLTCLLLYLLSPLRTRKLEPREDCED